MLEIKRFTFGPFQTNMYVVSEGGRAVLIDPCCFGTGELQQLLRHIESEALHVEAIIATHGHLDHLWGAKWTCAQFGLPVLLHEADIPMAKAMQQQYELFGIPLQAESFPIETLSSQLSSFNFQVLPTPGHTPGCICLYHEQDGVLFSGDTLFQMGYGRTDLPGGNTGQLIESLGRLFELPPATRVYPGHGESTTIGAEAR